MKYMRTAIKYMIGVFALLFSGCDSIQEDIDCSEGATEVLLSATGGEYIQTRASEPIGSNESGLKFGTFYLLQTTAQAETEKLSWGHYQVTDGAAGRLSPIDDEHKLFWADRDTKYFFRAISVPKVEGDALPGVTFEHEETTGEAIGTVRFGDYKTGLEYFVGVTVGPTSVTESPVLTMDFKRQVCKLIFVSFKHLDAKNQPDYPEECTIMFPNLPAVATFDMEHFRAKEETYDPGKGIVKGNDYVTLVAGENRMGAKMEWHKTQTSIDAAMLIEHAFYLPPFRFWDGADNIPENQPGFFIVTLTNGKTYTGNLYGNDNITGLYAGEYNRLVEVTLKDGPAVGGGEGSAIASWLQSPPTEHPHHRLPGIYSKEDAEALLDALQNGKDIPATFYQEDETTEGKKIIRLFMNIDWSSVTGEVKIPDDCVLIGQGFNIKLGDGGSITGEIQGELYINGKLRKD